MTVSTVSLVGKDVGKLVMEGEVLDLQGNADVEVFFDYGLTDTWGNESERLVVSETGPFQIEVGGLSDKTTYHARAVMVDGENAWYGNDVTGITNNACGLSQEETDILLNERNNDPLDIGLKTCSKYQFWQYLTKPGTASVKEYIVPNAEVICTKADILKILSNASIASFRTWLNSEADDDAIAVKELWESYVKIDMAHSRVRQMVAVMDSSGFGHWTDNEVDRVLKLGERLMSRSVELFDRDLKLSEITCDIQ